MERNYKIFTFQGNQHHKGILRLSLNPQLLTEKLFICYHVRSLLTQNTASMFMCIICLESKYDFLFTLYYYPWCHIIEWHSWFHRHQHQTLFTFKCYLYKVRDLQNLSFLAFKNNIIKETKFLKKWQIINNDAVVIIIFSLQNPMIPMT